MRIIQTTRTVIVAEVRLDRQRILIAYINRFNLLRSYSYDMPRFHIKTSFVIYCVTDVTDVANNNQESKTFRYFVKLEFCL